MERIECYYRRGRGKSYDIMIQNVEEGGEVLMIKGVRIVSEPDFSLVRKIPRPFSDFLNVCDVEFDELGDIFNFWGGECLNHLPILHCFHQFSYEELRGLRGFVRVEEGEVGDFWICLVMKIFLNDLGYSYASINFANYSDACRWMNCFIKSGGARGMNLWVYKCLIRFMKMMGGG